MSGETNAANPARHLAGEALAAALRDSRARTLAWTDDLSDTQWSVPRQRGINPPRWELAHIAWFAEFWMLRGPHRVDERGLVRAAQAPRHLGPDELLDSAQLPHAARWHAPLATREALRTQMAAQLEACIAALAHDARPELTYFARLSLFHEDMHGEALAWMRATLGHAPPVDCTLADVPPAAAVQMRSAHVRLGGARAHDGFAFDNELPGRELLLRDYEIDATPVTAEQFRRFVEAGGYDTPAFWPDAAGAWRAQAGRSHPARWRRGVQGWEHRWFDRWLPLAPRQPVIHVNAYEAEAYCRWAGRRLPSAAEWEHAAPHIVWGRSVWEWTADAFAPHPGFVAGPYKDYSAPWFGDHRELRGGAFVTHERMHDARYRNFFTPERDDVFAGFRTASL